MKKEQAIRMALNHAEEKFHSGLLVPCNHPNYDELMSNPDNYIDGDLDTVHSVVSLFSDDEGNDGTWEDEIEDAIRKRYPSFF